MQTQDFNFEPVLFTFIIHYLHSCHLVKVFSSTELTWLFLCRKANYTYYISDADINASFYASFNKAGLKYSNSEAYQCRYR